MKNIYYGDNLEVLRSTIKSETVDLCYIDPPFNSKRNYFQIYNNIGEEKDVASSQAFVDTWTWNNGAIEAYQEIISNRGNRFTERVIDLIRGLKLVLREGALFAYLISMTLRITEIHRVLKPTGSFYLHCDPTASHYLKLVLDAIFCSQGGEIRNEIIWCYSRMAAKGQKQLSRCHDVIFWYSKGKEWLFNVDDVRLPYSEKSLARAGYKKTNLGGGSPASQICELNEKGKFPEDWVQIPFIRGKEYLGYPTQKPESLLERIIKASSNEGDLILDAYCGCGTTINVAEKLKRQWIGIDITYKSISLILKRLENSFGKQIINEINLAGIPKDIESAKALANKKDDRLRKEFETWAILTYSNSTAIINDKKGADKGIDGVAYFLTSKVDSEKIVFQVKSGKVGRKDIAQLKGDMKDAKMAIFITLEEPTKPMYEEAKLAGSYYHELMQRNYDCIQIVTIAEILNENKRLAIPLSIEVIKKAEDKSKAVQDDIGFVA